MASDVMLVENAGRRRHWWRWLIVAFVGLIVLTAGGFWMLQYFDNKAWTDACAEADRLDPGWRWDNLMAARPIPPADRNVSARVHAVYDALPPGWPNWTTAVRPEDVPPRPQPKPADDRPPGLADVVIESAEEARASYGQTLEQKIDEHSPNEQLRPTETAALNVVIGAAAEALGKTAGIEELPASRMARDRVHPLDLSFSQYQRYRNVSQLLKLRATLRAQDGDLDSALADCGRMLAAARAASAEPMLINALVTMAIRAVTVGRVERALAQGEPGSPALEQMQRALESALAEPLLLDMLRGERAWYEDLVRAVDEGLIPPESAADDPTIPSVTGYATIDRILHRLRGGGWSKRDSAVQLRFQNLLIELAKASPGNLRARSAEIAAFRATLSARVQSSIQGYDQMLDGERRSRALLSSASAALAAERFRRDKRRWPVNLDELVEAKLLTNVPADPFDGLPMRFKSLADGLVIYSVGQDLVDDGGENSSNPTNPNFLKDVGFRLWDPAQRRQPAPPPKP
jgi:hypothetical protein